MLDHQYRETPFNSRYLIQNIDSNIYVRFSSRNTGKLHSILNGIGNEVLRINSAVEDNFANYSLRPTHKTRLYYPGASFCKKAKEELS